MSQNKLKTLTVLIFLFIGGGAFFVFAFQALKFLNRPRDIKAEERIFTVEPGQTLDAIADNLERESLVSDKTFFKLLALYRKSGKKIQAGEYLLSGAKTPQQILEILLKGRVKLYRITIPEGLSIKETSLLFGNADLCPRDDFIRLCYDRAFIESLKIKSKSLEGYLFPDTYLFPRYTKCRSVIVSMVEQFNNVYIPEWKDRGKKLGFSVHEIVTLASIIEKETGDSSERPLVSSVFHNRLKKNMRLQSDPTVIYGIRDFDGNIRKIHLKIMTPYNTYQIKGLPPGPIANPGAMSIKAALYPENTDYLFFVSKKDSTHKFSRTIKEHNRAVKKYQMKK